MLAIYFCNFSRCVPASHNNVLLAIVLRLVYNLQGRFFNRCSMIVVDFLETPIRSSTEQQTQCMDDAAVTAQMLDKVKIE